MDNVKISCKKGTVRLNDYDREVIKRLTNEYKMKFQRHFDNIIGFEVRVKCHFKKGNLRRYSVSSKLVVPGQRFEASDEDYDLAGSVHNSLKKIMAEISHRMGLTVS